MCFFSNPRNVPQKLAYHCIQLITKYGDVKSTTASLSALTLIAESTMSVCLVTNSRIKPFHWPFSNVPNFGSSTLLQNNPFNFTINTHVIYFQDYKSYVFIYSYHKHSYLTNSKVKRSSSWRSARRSMQRPAVENAESLRRKATT